LHSDEDRDLQGLFDALREKEQDDVPAFRTLLARAKGEASGYGTDTSTVGRPHRLTVRRLAWGGSLLAAAAAAFLFLLSPRGTSDAEFVQVVQMFSGDPASGAWRSPTDALLDLPGSELLNTIPSIGSHRWTLEPSANRRRNEL
jgi:hypothetical protein